MTAPQSAGRISRDVVDREMAWVATVGAGPPLVRPVDTSRSDYGRFSNLSGEVQRGRR